jgi:predicted MFS family arabinose efflux permease
VARLEFPLPDRLEEGETAPARGFTRGYWLYMVAGALFAAGLMSFELISYHLATTGTVSQQWLPVFLALSTLFGVGASLLLGRLYDKHGIRIVLVAVALSALFPPLVFFGGFYTALGGMVLWGIGYATQDTLLKALIASVLPEGKRNTAFGLFYAGYAVGWLVGSVATGLLYDRSLIALVVVAMAFQLAALPVFALAANAKR